MQDDLGNQLVAFCGQASREVLLVAPFMKRGALQRLLTALPPQVALTCVTRWRPEEIAAGVSDLDVWPLLGARAGSQLWLRPDLHAKYYRTDGECLVGSANLTATALGWCRHPNLELLVPIRADDPHLLGFESSLLSGCIRVNDDTYEQMRSIAELIEDHLPDLRLLGDVPIESSLAEESDSEPVPAEAWLPQLRNPADLFSFYSGKTDGLIMASRIAAKNDLAALPIASGLPKPLFESCIGALLLLKPIPRRIDDFVLNSRRFGAVRDLLSELPCAMNDDFNASRAWQTLMRWLLYFLPDRYSYSVPNHSEIFSRVPATSRMVE